MVHEVVVYLLKLLTAPATFPVVRPVMSIVNPPLFEVWVSAPERLSQSQPGSTPLVPVELLISHW